MDIKRGLIDLSNEEALSLYSCPPQPHLLLQWAISLMYNKKTWKTRSWNTVISFPNLTVRSRKVTFGNTSNWSRKRNQALCHRQHVSVGFTSHQFSYREMGFLRHSFCSHLQIADCWDLCQHYPVYTNHVLSIQFQEKQQNCVYLFHFIETISVSLNYRAGQQPLWDSLTRLLSQWCSGKLEKSPR